MKRNKMNNHGYKEKVTDEDLLNLIESGVANSVGDFLNSSDLARERQKATYEYGMMATGHLSPQGVSQIVSSDTVEAVEGYTAILAELLFNNNKIAKFTPLGKTPTDSHKAKVASDLVNYVVFKQNRGWELLNSWTKAALLWKNSIVRWAYEEDHDYTFETFEEIDQMSLDILLAEDDTEVVGELQAVLELIEDEQGGSSYQNKYLNVRIRRKIDKSRVAIHHVHPEAFRISRDGDSIDNCSFVAIQVDMTRSEIRKYWPEESETIDWDRLGDGDTDWSTKYTEEQAARKKLVGQEYWQGSQSRELLPLEANREVTVIECWIRVDRDGDGIAELKHIVKAGSHILLEEDADYVPMASLCPFEVPYEFHGLSAADMTRPSTMATTAILRGFVENVYLTNYSPKLADPNVVDFSALQNMKPKQVIATNGNPNTAVASLTPDTISQGTVPLLEMLQLHKEQANGLSKAAQGLNDTLYVSGNSEEKMSRAMSASQVRIQYMARRFTETGVKRFVEGVYREIRKNMKGRKIEYYDQNNYLHQVDPASLPDRMVLTVDADVGDHSNSNMLKKLNLVGNQLLPKLQEIGAGGAVNPEAAMRIAAQTLEALDMDPLDYLVDYTTDDFKAKAEESRKAEAAAQEKMKKLQEQMEQLDMMAKQATIALTNVQSKNSLQDNTRQLMIALDRSYQEWAKLAISAAKEGVDAPVRPSIHELLAVATQQVMPEQDASMPVGTPAIPGVEGPAADVMPAQ
jgi:alkylhydroperoxidase/carboxymuconolactone decarboxylase family protein YurZ